MVGKLLEELSKGELRIAMEIAGIEGVYSEAQCVIRLTAHLVVTGEDAYTFKFNIDDKIHEVEEEIVPGDYVIITDAVETTSFGPSVNAGISASGLEGCSSETVSEPVSPFLASSTVSMSSFPLRISARDSTETSFFTDVDSLCVFFGYEMSAVQTHKQRPVAWTPYDSYASYHREYGGAFVSLLINQSQSSSSLLMTC